MYMTIKATEAECRDGMARTELAFIANAHQRCSEQASGMFSSNVREASFAPRDNAPSLQQMQTARVAAQR